MTPPLDSARMALERTSLLLLTCYLSNLELYLSKKSLPSLKQWQKLNRISPHKKCTSKFAPKDHAKVLSLLSSCAWLSEKAGCITWAAHGRQRWDCRSIMVVGRTWQCSVMPIQIFGSVQDVDDKLVLNDQLTMHSMSRIRTFLVKTEVWKFNLAHFYWCSV